MNAPLATLCSQRREHCQNKQAAQRRSWHGILMVTQTPPSVTTESRIAPNSSPAEYQGSAPFPSATPLIRNRGVHVAGDRGGAEQARASHSRTVRVRDAAHGRAEPIRPANRAIERLAG